MAVDEKFGQLKRLLDAGKEKGYVLYDEVNEILPDDAVPGPELDDLLADLDTAGVEILEEPRLDLEKKADEPEELAELDLGPPRLGQLSRFGGLHGQPQSRR